MTNHSAGALRPLALATLLLGGATVVRAEETPAPPEKVAWTPGPATVDIGGSLAELRLPESLAFAGPADTRRLLEAMGNPTDGSELGLVVPKADGQDWFIIFEWRATGYVKDDDKDEIDAHAPLKSILQGTAEANE